jgi:hypothetical protein
MHHGVENGACYEMLLLYVRTVSTAVNRNGEWIEPKPETLNVT